MRHLFSSRRRGLFVSVDGPSGAGKSTIVRHLAQMLVAAGEPVHVTAEPSDGPAPRAGERGSRCWWRDRRQVQLHPIALVPARGRARPLLGAVSGFPAGRVGPARDWPSRDFLELGALPGAVPYARHHSRRVLWEWHLGELSDSAELLVS
jgi:energy-coupling factor transporter ATP-binding protein EcfA2